MQKDPAPAADGGFALEADRPEEAARPRRSRSKPGTAEASAELDRLRAENARLEAEIAELRRRTGGVCPACQGRGYLIGGVGRIRCSCRSRIEA